MLRLILVQDGRKYQSRNDIEITGTSSVQKKNSLRIYQLDEVTQGRKAY
jgi:hypothetical protein